VEMRLEVKETLSKKGCGDLIYFSKPVAVSATSTDMANDIRKKTLISRSKCMSLANDF
jgi:hypothetical protein